MTFGEDLILAGLAHTRDLVLLAGHIIPEGSCNDALSITGNTGALTDTGGTVLAVEDDLREEGVDLRCFVCRLHVDHYTLLSTTCKKNFRKNCIVSLGLERV